MGKIRPVHLIGMIIGVLGVAYGIYGYFKGKAFSDFGPPLIICALLFLVAYLNSRRSN